MIFSSRPNPYAQPYAISPAGRYAYLGVVQGIANLVACWPLSEASGTSAADASGNGWTGTYQNSPSLANAAAPGATMGKAALFAKASTQWVDTANITTVNGLTALTVAGWINIAALALNLTIISKYDYPNQSSWTLQVSNSNSKDLLFFIAHNAGDGGPAFANTSNQPLASANTWYHVACVYDGSQANSSRVKFYVNGAGVATGIGSTIPTSLTSATSHVALGNWSNNSLVRPFDGLLSFLCIYSRALTSAEIATLGTAF